ncbi:hypothetical protein REPUB_Repub13aG0165900 [Reevesia pubescens]
MESFGSLDKNTYRDQIASNDGACTFLVNANMLGQNMVENNVSVEFSSPCFEFGPKCRLKSFVQALLNDNNLSNPEDHDLKFIPRKDAPKVIEDQPNRKCCIAEVDVESLHRLEKCYVGIANRCYEAGFLLDKFKREGIVNVSIKKITSYHFLLEFEDEATRQMVFSGEWSWLNVWLFKFLPWSKEFSVKSRSTWLYYVGVPLHAWNYSTFCNIVDLWGVLVSIDDKSLSFEEFIQGAIFISTDHFGKIDEIIDFHCGNKAVLVNEDFSDFVDPIDVLHKVDVSSNSFEVGNYSNKLKTNGILETSLCNSSSDAIPENEISYEDEQSVSKENVIVAKSGRRITELEGVASMSYDIMRENLLALKGSVVILSKEVVPETEDSCMEKSLSPNNAGVDSILGTNIPVGYCIFAAVAKIDCELALDFDHLWDFQQIKMGSVNLGMRIFSLQRMLQSLIVNQMWAMCLITWTHALILLATV